MKHKIIFITILTLFIALYGYAQIGITIKPYLGYSTVSMSDVNKRIDEFRDLQGAQVQVDLLDHALLGGARLGYDVLNDPSIGNLNIGIEAYYPYVFPGRITISVSDTIIYELTFNASLIPILGGITYTYNIDPIYLGANASVGYGFSSFSITARQVQLNTTTNLSYSENGLVAEGKLIIGLNIIKELSVELNVGYRYAPIGQIPPNILLLTTNSIRTDFSGIIATLGANIRL